jgi:hypothetical protein
MFARNLFDTHYIQNLTIRAGHSGLILGTPGDLRIIEARSPAALRSVQRTVNSSVDCCALTGCGKRRLP